jgi:hypothetical protein
MLKVCMTKRAVYRFNEDGPASLKFPPNAVLVDPSVPRPLSYLDGARHSRLSPKAKTSDRSVVRPARSGGDEYLAVVHSLGLGQSSSEKNLAVKGVGLGE